MAVSKRAAGVAPSLTLAITAAAKKMKEEGIKTVSFGAGEPDFNTPDYIVAAAKVALDKGLTKYTPSGGTLSLKKAICAKFLLDNGLAYTPEQIVVSNGAKHSLYNAFQAIIDDGDEVIIPAPYWLTYPELVKLSGGVPKIVYTKRADGFKLTPDAFNGALTKRTKAVVINSPCNPTGAVYTEAELRALAAVIEKSGVYVIADEIYEELIYDGLKRFSIAAASKNLFDRTVTVNGVSKTYAMTGWRIGYLAAPPEIARAIDGMQSHTTSNPNSIAQYAAEAALAGGAEFSRTLAGTFDARRTLMLKLLDGIKGISYPRPQGAFYVLINVAELFGKSFNGVKITSAQVFAELLLKRALTAVVPCEAFGAPDSVRLSYAVCDDDIKKGVESIKNFIAELR